MRIGLIDVDGHNFPNLALMKLSAWHKAQGDDVVWWNGFEHYDIVYMSKVFTFTPDVDVVIDADKVVRGGTGYKDYGSLPAKIEHIFPDYSMYPQYDYAIGFLTRGCIRKCPWCIVPKKEGWIRANDTWRHIKRPDSNKIVFMDNNVLACDHGLAQIEDMGGQKVKVDFNQGLDARKIDKRVAVMLAKLKWIRFVRFSTDTKAMVEPVKQAVAYLKESGISARRLFSYVLVTDDIDDALYRVEELRKLGVNPFAQPYRDFDGGEPSEEQKAFTRWVNRKEIFKSVPWSDYKWRKNDG